MQKKKKRYEQKIRSNPKKYRKQRKPAQKAPYTDKEYWCIDGNWTHHPAAYCTHYHGVLTAGLIRTHRCRHRCCKRFKRWFDND